MADDRVQLAEQLIRGFAARTGLSGGAGIARRYLWTDAFAVFALIGLHQRTQIKEYLEWALGLVDSVHHELGRHRPDDHRSGWISGLSETDGERRPTAGGLRIGKPLPERKPGEPYDEQLEWERDGQYFHYLTKWVHALDRVSNATGEQRLLEWAIDLAAAGHRGFVYQMQPGGPKRMRWKMSIDLTRPLVASMGQHDPLDGLVVCGLLQARHSRGGAARIELDAAAGDFGRICADFSSWLTGDPLGIGGLLCDACVVAQLIALGEGRFVDLLPKLLRDAQGGLEVYVSGREHTLHPGMRLAFRELGLVIGLQSIDILRAAAERCPERFGGGLDAVRGALDSLSAFSPLIGQIERTWLAPQAQAVSTWTEHLDINSVMLATSLVPDACLNLGQPGDPEQAGGQRPSRLKELSP